MTEPELIIETDSRGIMRMTLNRPHVHNAFDEHQILRIIDALRDAGENPALRALIIAGNGKSFCAGGDIDYMRRMGGNSYDDNLKDASQLAEMLRLLRQFPRPTIARIHGAAFGGGVGLAACCDITIGTPKTKFCLSEVKLGMMPATIAPYVIRVMGATAARRYFMTAEIIDAQRALTLGMLGEVVAEDALDDTIDGVVSSLLGNAPGAVQIAKRLVNDIAHGPVTDDMIADTVALIADVRGSDEGREGLTAFLEKRQPSWAQ